MRREMDSTAVAPQGKVSLVGAGPGDPGLLTVKALARIKEADLIVYDYLANPEHLRQAKASAKKIGVGKGFRHRRLSQRRINRLIIRAAKNGKKVVRLKGGDPYLFGRGGEEALFLEKNHIPFEVVPGVTSAMACAAYSGIPLTHRDHTAAVTFLTGHRAHDKNLDSVGWKHIVALNGTLVIYMGFYNLRKITERLMEYGMPRDTKISVIEWGTLPRQKSCNGTLKNIVRIVSRKKMKAPSIIIIGEVVSLSRRLNWFEKLPLFGKKIVITRSRDKAAALREKLSNLGASVIELPTIEIKAAVNLDALDRSLRRLTEWNWIVFTSTYAVEAFFDRLEQKAGKDARHLGSVQIACVGPDTGAALRKRGVLADLMPRRYETLAIVDEFRKRFKRLNNQKILLPRTDIAPPALEKGLKRLGASVCRVTAYRTSRPGVSSLKTRNEILKRPADYITFTSSSTVLNASTLVGPKALRKISKRTCFASIGPVTSSALKEHGLRPGCEAKNFTIDGLIHAIINHAKKHRKD